MKAYLIIISVLACTSGDSINVYLAAPLSTNEERQLNADVARFLRGEGMNVWLPQEHDAPLSTPLQIFMNDTHGIDNADIVVARMDRCSVGTAWECGYAYHANKPVILFRTDAQYDYGLMLTEGCVDSVHGPDFMQNLLGSILAVVDPCFPLPLRNERDRL